VRLTDLQQHLSVSKATAYRLLSTLAARGYVEQDPKTRTYRLGLGFFQLASAALDARLLRESVRDCMRELRDLSGESVHLGVFDGTEVVYIDRVESQAVMRVVLAIGQREPLHCTASGKVLLAYRPPDELRSFLDAQGLPGFTRNTITDKDVLAQHLDLVRQRGYAVDDEEHTLAVRCFAFPVRDRTGDVIAAISIAGPAFRFTADMVERLTDDFLAIAGQISARLGYRGALARKSVY